MTHPGGYPSTPYGYAPTPPPPRRGPSPWMVLLGFVAGVAGLAGIVLGIIAITGDNDAAPPTAPTSVEDVPAPITRSEVMRRYAEINPRDKSATPERVDSLATTICDALDNGQTTDDVITVGTEAWGAAATEVTMLLVEYKCPKRLADFK